MENQLITVDSGEFGGFDYKVMENIQDGTFEIISSLGVFFGKTENQAWDNFVKSVTEFEEEDAEKIRVARRYL